MNDPLLSKEAGTLSWEDFVAWCETRGVHKADLQPWWDCWCEANASYRRHIRAAVGSPLDP